MREFDIVEMFSNKHGSTRGDVGTGIGDDAAQITPLAGKRLVVASRIFSGDHYFKDTAAAQQLATESIAVTTSKLRLSDGIPCWLTIALTLPAEHQAWITGFVDSIQQQAMLHDIQIVGGDTTHGPFSLTLHLMGYARI